MPKLSNTRENPERARLANMLSRMVELERKKSSALKKMDVAQLLRISEKEAVLVEQFEDVRHLKDDVQHFPEGRQKAVLKDLVARLDSYHRVNKVLLKEISDMGAHLLRHLEKQEQYSSDGTKQATRKQFFQAIA